MRILTHMISNLQNNFRLKAKNPFKNNTILLSMRPLLHQLGEEIYFKNKQINNNHRLPRKKIKIHKNSPTKCRGKKLRMREINLLMINTRLKMMRRILKKEKSPNKPLKKMRRTKKGVKKVGIKVKEVSI